jgi:S-adenosylmethionine-diacylgycerolhomoserine-N-methlytransferase
MAQEELRGDHAALMDAVYRRQRFVYDLTRKYYLFGRDRLIRELALRPGERLVEVGCGTARNLIKIAHRYPEARLFGLDASQEMLKSAAESLDRAGLSGRVKLVQGYAEHLSPELFGETLPFDRAVFSYSLSMIPDWRAALAAADAALSESGKIHVVDFGDLTGMGSVGARSLRAWLALFHVEPRTEILHGLEAMNGHKSGLWISPARYAFLWTAGRDGARGFHA